MTIRIDGSNTTANPGITGADADTGLQFGTNEVKIVTGGSDRVTVDSSGRVGIGTTSPAGTLDVRNAASDPNFYLYNEGDTSAQRGNSLRYGFSDGIGASVRAVRPSAGSNTDVYLSFGAGGDTERARIDSSGRLLVGTASGSGNQLLKVQGNVASANNGAIFTLARGTTPTVGSNALGEISFRQGTDEYVGATIEAQSDAGWTAGTSHPSRLIFSTTASGAPSPTESLRIDNAGILYSVPTYNNTTGSTTNYLRIGSDGQIYRSTSSIAYKTDVEDMDDAYADAILNLRPVWYRSTCESDNPNHSHWGFIAEEVEQVDPRLCSFKDFEVTYDEEGKQVVTPLDTPVVDGVDYASLTPLLLNLIKRQNARIETLEAEVQALKGGINP